MACFPCDLYIVSSICTIVHLPITAPEQSWPWVGPIRELGRVGFSAFCFSVNRIGWGLIAVGQVGSGRALGGSDSDLVSLLGLLLTYFNFN